MAILLHGFDDLTVVGICAKEFLEMSICQHLGRSIMTGDLFDLTVVGKCLNDFH